MDKEVIVAIVGAVGAIIAAGVTGFFAGRAKTPKSEDVKITINIERLYTQKLFEQKGRKKNDQRR
ncbi:MAG: hypothetical protein LBC75_02565 [Fibromonadaceae bacterium]|jgi:hypothetical protein|nr:hypothetical protein [Fibromonadaceae bacterium]